MKVFKHGIFGAYPFCEKQLIEAKKRGIDIEEIARKENEKIRSRINIACIIGAIAIAAWCGIIIAIAVTG